MKIKHGILHPGFLQQQQQQQLQQLQKQQIIQPKMHKIDIAKATTKKNIRLIYVVRLFFTWSLNSNKFLRRPPSGSSGLFGLLFPGCISSPSSSSLSFESPSIKFLIKEIRA